MQIHALMEGLFFATETEGLVPYTPENEARIARKMLVSICPFLIIDGDRKILLDSGLGYAKEDTNTLIYSLRVHNIMPEEITHILFSHLHHDHINGSILPPRPNDGSVIKKEDYQLAFPKATHYIHKHHFEYMLATGYEEEKKHIAFLARNATICWLEDEVSGNIAEHITYGVSSGHCPFHMHFFLRTNEGKTIFYGGDEAPQLSQMKMRLVARYDYDGKEAARLRKLWWEQAQKELWTILFFHDPKHVIYSFH